MIDTVTIILPVEPDDRMLVDWVADVRKIEGKIIYSQYSKNVTLDNEASLNFRFYPSNQSRYPNGWKFKEPRLTVQASLPQVLFGSNIPMITDETEVFEAGQKINTILSRELWIPTVDVLDGILWRADFVVNYQVGLLVPRYIEALSRLIYPHRSTINYRSQGVQYKSMEKSTKFYDKEKDSRLSIAHGILRHESTYRKTDNIEEQLGKIQPTLKDITKERVVQSLINDQEQLSIKDGVLSTDSFAQDRLVEKYGWAKGVSLFGFLMICQNSTQSELVENGYSIHTYRKFRQQIKKAGLSMSMTSNLSNLPKLEVCLN